MPSMIERCAGLDVHQATVMATVRIPSSLQARITRRAISPRLAMSTFLNTGKRFHHKGAKNTKN